MYDPPFGNPKFYKSLVGVLQYLTITRPDQSFAINVACQHMHNLCMSHYIALKRIVRYVKGTLKYVLNFTQGPLVLHAYSDTNWAGDRVDRKSTSGITEYFEHNLVM